MFSRKIIKSVRLLNRQHFRMLLINTVKINSLYRYFHWPVSLICGNYVVEIESILIEFHVSIYIAENEGIKRRIIRLLVYENILLFSINKWAKYSFNYSLTKSRILLLTFSFLQTIFMMKKAFKFNQQTTGRQNNKIF